MTKVVSFNGQSIEFPDSMSDDQIASALKANALNIQPAKRPVDDPGMLSSLLIGAGRTFDRIGKGAQQLYYGARSAMSGPDATSLVTGGKNQWDLKLDNLKRAAESDDAVYQPLQELRPWSTGVGSALPSLAIPGGGGATLGANMLRMAVAGALPGALEYGSGGERLSRAALGAAAGATVPVAGAILKTGKAFAEPLYQAGRDAILGRLLNRVAGDDAPGVIQRMASAGELVPGSAPTAAQVAENGGVSALERAAAQANPADYADRRLAQAFARKNAIDTVAGSPAELDALMKARSQVASATYGLAREAGPDARVFTPEAQANIAAMQSRVPATALDYAKQIATLKGEPMDSANVISGLQWTKEALRDLANSQNNGPALKNALGELADQFNQGLRNISPLQGAADDIYASMSKPIGQMQIGQALRAKALPALEEHGLLGQERAQMYAQALADSSLPAKATGFPGATWENMMTPEQMKTLTSVAQDMARLKNAENLGRGVGSDTFQKLAMNNIAQQSGMPRLMGGLLDFPGIGRATRWIYEDADKKMQSMLSDALLNPKTGAAIMSKSARGLLADDPVARKVLEQSVLRAGLLGAPAAYSLTE